MLEHIILVKDRVLHILEKYPETRDSDKLLWLAYLCLFHDLQSRIGKESYLKLKDLMMEPTTSPMESVRRMRAKLQSEGFYRGDKYLERLAEANSVHDYFADELRDQQD